MSIPHIKRKEWDKGLEEGKRKYGERGGSLVVRH